jgi:serine/threonine protein phosphatase 1
MMTQTLAPARLPPHQRIYAVGDVHGCAARLDDLHGVIADDLRDRPVAHALVIHLGDYIDRGDDSAGVIERLIGPFPCHTGAPPLVVNLMGNHEDMLLSAIRGDRAAMANWLRNGGATTLASWGVNEADGTGGWQRAIPPTHLGFLRALGVIHRVGGYVFVHAGLRPGIRLAAQSRRDLMWIREPFLSFTGALPGVVVHGHTPEAEPVVRDNRIGVDTGAVMGGALTCAVLEGDRIGFLQS